MESLVNNGSSPPPTIQFPVSRFINPADHRHRRHEHGQEDPVDKRKVMDEMDFFADKSKDENAGRKDLHAPTELDFSINVSCVCFHPISTVLCCVMRETCDHYSSVCLA